MTVKNEKIASIEGNIVLSKKAIGEIVMGYLDNEVLGLYAKPISLEWEKDGYLVVRCGFQGENP